MKIIKVSDHITVLACFLTAISNVNAIHVKTIVVYTLIVMEEDDSLWYRKKQCRNLKVSITLYHFHP